MWSGGMPAASVMARRMSEMIREDSSVLRDWPFDFDLLRTSAATMNRSVPFLGSGAPKATTQPVRTPGVRPAISSISCG